MSQRVTPLMIEPMSHQHPLSVISSKLTSFDLNFGHQANIVSNKDEHEEDKNEK
jgi:hypothetical protein